jgi:2-methylcitrate dehydratase PrpD
VQIFFKDGSESEQVTVEYPIGHRRRRGEGIPELVRKFKTNLARRFPERQQKAILEVCNDEARLSEMPAHDFVDLFVI